MVELGSSPYINHFIQPDTIIPNPANPQSWNRYSYVQNNPIRYTDPTGHMICGDTCVKKLNSVPEYIDPTNLTIAGKAAYKTYLRVFYSFDEWWWDDPNLGGDGKFTVEDFVTMNYNEELSTLNASIVSEWQAGLVRSFFSWKQAMPTQYTLGAAGLLNFMSTHNGLTTRTSPANFDGPTKGLSTARGAVDAMIDPIGSGHSDWAEGCIVNEPCRIGSHAPGDPDLPYINQFINSGCQPSYALFPPGSCDWNKAFLFILDAADANYWDSQ